MKSKIRFAVISLILYLLLAGCANMKTSKSQFEGMNEKLRNRDYAAAIKQLEAAKEDGYKKKDRVVYYLDLGMLYHFNGQYQKSNEYLTNAERAIEDLYTNSISRIAASLLLNDNTLEYAGEDYEDIYLNIFKALNYIELNNQEASFVEIRKVHNKLNVLEDKYKKVAHGFNKSKSKLKFKPAKNEFHNSALARYLSMLLYRYERQFDEARIDANKISEAFQLQSQIYNFSPPKINHLLQSNEATLNFVAFTGKGPDKKANTLYVHTEKDRVYIATSSENKKGNQKLDTLDEFTWPGMKAGYHFKFQLPYLQESKSKIGSVRIKVNGKTKKELKLLEDISRVAVKTYEVKKPIIYLKSISRAILKGIAAEKGKAKLNEQVGGGLQGKLLSFATDMAVDATENADLRISRFFPGKAMVGEIKLNPGTYNISLEYVSKNGTTLWTDNLGEKTVTANSSNIFESFYLY